MSRLWLVACASLLAACSSSSNASNDAADSGAGSSDAGGFAPADHPAAPTVPKLKGSVLAAPKIVVVTFGDDPLASQIESFASQIGASKYWSATTSEYGVGPITFGGAVHVDAPPAKTVTTDQLEAWLASQLDGTHSEWPAADPNTIYTIVYPKGSGIEVDGVPACQSSPAYHYEVKLGSGVHVPYAAMNRCDPAFGLDGIDYVTAGLSHEWIEASTDPLYASAPAYQAPASADWMIATGGELADLCTTTIKGIYYKPDDLAFTVQRSWSNAAAAAGHDPCVPAADGPYFSAAPVLTDTVRGHYYGGAFSSDGAKVAIGQSTTIEVDLFSDDATDPWNVSATAFGGAKLQFAWDATSGSNGDKLHLTVTRVADSTDITGASIFSITSSSGSKESVWIGAVGD